MSDYHQFINYTVFAVKQPDNEDIDKEDCLRAYCFESLADGKRRFFACTSSVFEDHYFSIKHESNPTAAGSTEGAEEVETEKGPEKGTGVKIALRDVDSFMHLIRIRDGEEKIEDVTELERTSL